MSSVIGIDLGGTKTALTLYDLATWKILAETKTETHAHNEFNHVYNDMLTQINSLKREDTVAVGVGVPGLVHQPEGKVLNMPNIPGSQNVLLKKMLETDLALPVKVDNDANCFALAEARHGAGKGAKVCVAVTMGTGVGGGIVIDGAIFGGANGFAGEIGHMLLKPGEPPYNTDDNRGEVEQFLSGTAFGKRCEVAGRPEDYLEGEVCEFMRPEVLKEVAWMCTNLIHLIDPDVIVFGGSAGFALNTHLPAIEKELGNWLLKGTPLPKLTVGTLKNAATHGAALLTQS